MWSLTRTLHQRVGFFCWALEPWKLQIFAASNDIPVRNPGGGTSQLGQAAVFFFWVAKFAMTKYLMCSMTNPRDGLWLDLPVHHVINQTIRWWFGTFFLFSYIGNGIITDFQSIIFQRGWSTINQLFVVAIPLESDHPWGVPGDFRQWLDVFCHAVTEIMHRLMVYPMVYPMVIPFFTVIPW